MWACPGCSIRQRMAHSTPRWSDQRYYSTCRLSSVLHSLEEEEEQVACPGCSYPQHPVMI